LKDYNISGTVKDNRDIYRSLFNGSPSISLLLDTKGYIKDVNKVAEIFLQENKENLIDKFLLNLKIVNKNNINEFRRLLKAIQICKKIKSLSLDLKLKKGTYWFKVNLNIIDNQKHPIIHVTFQDISYLKFVEIELEKQKHQLNFFLENIDDLIIIIDKNFLIKKINKIAFKKILGYDEQDIIGHRILEFVHKADQEKAINIMKDTILRGRKYGKNIRFKAKNGKYFNGEIKFQSIFHEKEFINFLIIIKIKSKREERILRSKNLYEKYKTLIKKLPEVVFEIDKNYKIIYTNKAASHVFKYQTEDFKKDLTIFDFIDPEETSFVLKLINDIFQDKLVDPPILHLRRKDGVYLYTRVFPIPVKENQKVVGLRAIIHDITELINAQEIIKESERKFKTITEQSLMGICIIQDSVIKYTNNTLANMLGYSVEEMLNWNPEEFYKVVCAYDKERVIKMGKDLLKHPDKVLESEEIRYVRKNGELVWFEVYSKIIPYMNRKAFLVTFIDITTRKKAMEMLKESEEKYRFIFKNSPLAIILLNMEGKIVECNSKFEESTQFKKREIIGKNLQDLPSINEELRLKIVQNLENLKNGVTTPSFEILIKKKSGDFIWVNLISTIINVNREPHILMVGIDITSKKEIENKLKELNEIRQKFIAKASHELKTPITTVFGAHQLIQELHNEKLDPEVQDLFNIAFNGTKKLKQIVEDLLDFSRIETGSIFIEKKLINLTDLINQCINDYKFLLKNKKQEIFKDIPENVNIFADLFNINLLLSNLLSNAIKYTPEKGKITITVKEERNAVLISIKDTGIGLTDDQIKELFKPFSKLSSNQVNDKDFKFKSTGLGLFLSKEIVKLHNGEIWAESEGINRGSTFHVKLPLME